MMESRNLYQPYDNSSSSEEENSTDHDTNSDTEPNLDVNLHLLNDGDEGLIQAVEETNQQQDIIPSCLPTQVSEANDNPTAFGPSEGQIPAAPQENTLYSCSPEIQTEQADGASGVVRRGEPQNGPSAEGRGDLPVDEMQGEQGTDLLDNAPNGQNTDITTDGSVGLDPAVDSQIVPQNTCLNNKINIVVDGHASNEEVLARQLHLELDIDAELSESTLFQKLDVLISMIMITMIFVLTLLFIQNVGHFEDVDYQTYVANIIDICFTIYAIALGFQFRGIILDSLDTCVICMKLAFGQTPETYHPEEYKLSKMMKRHIIILALSS